MKEPVFILFLVVGGAALVPFFAGRLRLPSAALEIIYGVVIFNTLLRAQPEWFAMLKELGLIYLMFLVGMELDLKKFLREKNLPWYIIITLTPLIVMPWIFYSLGYPWFLGITVAMVSAGIIIPVLRESGIMDTKTGRDMIGAALTGELLSIIVLMAADIHNQYGFTARAVMESGKLIALAMMAGLFLKVLYVMAWWNPEKVKKVMESKDPVEEGIRIIIFVALGGALIAWSSGLEPILGSFFAGLVFSYVFRSKGKFEDKINAVGFGFFIPFFFIGTGAEFNIHLLRSLDNISLSLFLTSMIFAGNILPLFFARFMKLKAIEALGVSLILSAPLSLMVVAGTLGRKLELITESGKDAVVLAAVFSSILYPTLFRPIARKMAADLKENVKDQT